MGISDDMQESILALIEDFRVVAALLLRGVILRVTCRVITWATGCWRRSCWPCRSCSDRNVARRCCCGDGTGQLTMEMTPGKPAADNESAGHMFSS